MKAHSNFLLLMLGALKMDQYYRVQYVRITRISVFCILQGSVSVRLNCGGKLKDFLANL